MVPSITRSEGTEALHEYRSAALIEEIERAVRERQWLMVQRLAAELHALDASSTLDGSLPSLTNTLTTSRSDIDIDSSISSHSSSGRINNYDRLTVLQARPLVYFNKEDGCCDQPMPPINFDGKKKP